VVWFHGKFVSCWVSFFKNYIFKVTYASETVAVGMPIQSHLVDENKRLKRKVNRVLKELKAADDVIADLNKDLEEKEAMKQLLLQKEATIEKLEHNFQVQREATDALADLIYKMKQEKLAASYGGEMASASSGGEMASASSGGEMASASSGGEMASASSGGKKAKKAKRAKGGGK